MKKFSLILVFVLFAQIVFGQQTTHKITQDERSYWVVAPRVGYDIIQWYDISQPYIDYKGGIMAGISIDKYWDWIGVGADFDYIKNQPESTYPTTGLRYPSGALISDFKLTEEKITRLFYGIGPDFKYQSNNNKFIAELNLRAGMGHVKGGKTILIADPGKSAVRLNEHAGFDDQVFSTKAQMRFTYKFSPRIGIQLGAYYLRHFGVQENTMSGLTSYYTMFTDQGDVLTLIDRAQEAGPKKVDISSFGAFLGVAFTFPKQVKEEIPQPKHYKVTVFAKDKYSGEVLPNTVVQLKNKAGEVVRSGTTNEYGAVSFEDVMPGDYRVEGSLYEVALDPNDIIASEFTPNQTIEKTILYSDKDFVIKGKAVICNTSTPLNGATIVLNGVHMNFTKSTLTEEDGLFILHLPSTGRYKLYGKKEGYMSNIQDISPQYYNRSQSLFVKIEICADEVQCKTIRLDDIHFDLDKSFIREDAKPELNKVVRFMKDNPNVKIELSAHTDSRASDAYNMKLSQRRAQAAVDYIVSQGISRSRLISKGYGESQLLNKCSNGVSCTEAQHQLNRRVEMKVICP